MAEGEGASNKVFGSGDNRWRGQIVDDSVWRDNILAGKYEDKDTPEGWGRRYKVRVFGEHDLGGATGFPITDEELPWAIVEFPITAGSGAGNCKQTPALRQGNIVTGYWADGHNKQMPVITGVLGNNEQNVMGTEYPVPVTESGEASLAVSAFPNKQLKLPDVNARPKPPQTALITKKPAPAGSTVPTPSPNAQLDPATSLPRSQDITPAIRADLNKANQIIDSRRAGGQELSAEAIAELKRFIVHKGIKQRNERLRSPFSPTVPGATTEALGEHLKTAEDIGREDKFQEKIVLMKPDCVVDSATKSIQIISDNLTQKIKIYTNSLTDYSAATQRPGDDFKKYVKDSACQISKYMKVIMQKVQEYTNKKLNAELTDVVAEMPSYMRAQFLDVKEENNKKLTKEFNGITDDMCGLIEDILDKSLGIDALVKTAMEKASGSSIGSGLGNFNGTTNQSHLQSGTGTGGTGTGGTGTGGTIITTTSGTTGTTTTTGTGVFAGVDTTIDLSGVPQPYNSGQVYSPGDSVLFNGKTYINKLTTIAGTDPLNVIHWSPINLLTAASSTDAQGNVSSSWTLAGASSDIEGDSYTYQNEEQKSYVKVPVCYAETIVGKVFAYNKENINNAVKKSVNGMNRYVEDMQSQLDYYEGTFKYKSQSPGDKAVIALSDEEGLGDDRGGAGYTTQNSVATSFRGSLKGGGETGSDLTVDIEVDKGGPAGRAPLFKDSQFVTSSIAAAISGQSTTADDHYFWITIMDKGTGYTLTHDDGSGPTPENTGILFGCPTNVVDHINEDGQSVPSPTPNSTGATVDIYFVSGVVQAVRCALPYTGSVSDNGYSIGDVLEILPNGASSAMWGSGNNTTTYNDPGCTSCSVTTTARIMINRKEVPDNPRVYGRLRGPINDNGIKIANGGTNYQVGQLVNIVQIGNPYPPEGNPANNTGAPQGGAPGGNGGVDASFTVVGVLDKGDKRAAVPDDPTTGGGGSAGFSNMLSSIGGMLGNLTSALDFDNMPANIFPFELPPNKALADYYTLGDAGGAAPDGEIPMMGEITKRANKTLEDLVPKVPMPFALPNNPPNINLKIPLQAKDAQTALDNTIAGWKNQASNLISNFEEQDYDIV